MPVIYHEEKIEVIFAPREKLFLYHYDPNFAELLGKGVHLLPIEMTRICLTEDIPVFVALRIWEYYLTEIEQVDEIVFITFQGFVAGFGSDQSWSDFSGPFRAGVLNLFKAYAAGVPLDDLAPRRD